MLIVSFDVGIKNLAYSIIEFDSDNENGSDNDSDNVSDVAPPHNYKVLKKTKLHSWRKIDLECTKHDLEKITNNLLEVLDTITYEQIDNVHSEKIVVVIENQPALKSPTMKSIQILIYGYFNTVAKYNSLDLQTKLLSAKSKLKYIETFSDYAKHIVELQKRTHEECVKSNKRIPKNKEGYAKNKNDSVQFTRWLLTEITNDTKHNNELDMLKKKDDVCDSYLQGLYYITNLKQK